MALSDEKTKQKQLFGYLSNISPVKSSSGRKHFNFNIHKNSETIREEIQAIEEAIENSRKDIDSTISRWRSSFPLTDEKSIGKADAFAKSASEFVENFCFNCNALQTSKSLIQILNNEDNNKRNQPVMETEFQQSIPRHQQNGG